MSNKGNINLRLEVPLKLLNHTFGLGIIQILSLTLTLLGDNLTLHSEVSGLKTLDRTQSQNRQPDIGKAPVDHRLDLAFHTAWNEGSRDRAQASPPRVNVFYIKCSSVLDL